MSTSVSPSVHELIEIQMSVIEQKAASFAITRVSSWACSCLPPVHSTPYRQPHHEHFAEGSRQVRFCMRCDRLCTDSILGRRCLPSYLERESPSFQVLRSVADMYALPGEPSNYRPRGHRKNANMDSILPCQGR
jgi:hypothetical protein